MKLFWCCVAALIATASSAVDVERTVKQVQTILQSNTQLPRLSREEIIQLLNDIRAEDASKSKSTSTSSSRESKEITSTTPYSKPFNVNDNEINQSTDLQDNIGADEKRHSIFVTAPIPEDSVETTTKAEPTVMVVLPYTPRDGSSLQELYTRPPRTEVLPESKLLPKPFTLDKLQQTRETTKALSQKKEDFPAELQAFLDAHGLKGKPGQDSFLLPLEGFKPLPAPKVVDGTVQLPENILLTYDLISPSDLKQHSDNVGLEPTAVNNFLYEPLHLDTPHELETASSEQDKTVLPLEMPKKRKTKSATEKPTFSPIDYDSIKVLPLNQGPNPFDEDRATLESEQNKRQASTTTEGSTATNSTEETTTVASLDAKTNAPAEDSKAENTDTGPSPSDLEDSFGGPAPEQPGDSELPPPIPPRKNGFYWMVDWNSFLEVGDGDSRPKVNIRFEPKLGDPQMFLPVTVP